MEGAKRKVEEAVEEIVREKGGKVEEEEEAKGLRKKSMSRQKSVSFTTYTTLFSGYHVSSFF